MGSLFGKPVPQFVRNDVSLQFYWFRMRNELVEFPDVVLTRHLFYGFVGTPGEFETYLPGIIAKLDPAIEFMGAKSLQQLNNMSRDTHKSCIKVQLGGSPDLLERFAACKECKIDDITKPFYCEHEQSYAGPKIKIDKSS